MECYMRPVGMSGVKEKETVKEGRTEILKLYCSKEDKMRYCIKENRRVK